MRVGELDHSEKLNRGAKIVRFALRIKKETNQLSIFLPHFYKIPTFVRLFFDCIDHFMVHDEFFLPREEQELMSRDGNFSLAEVDLGNS